MYIQMTAHRDTLVKQVQEALQIRQTEPEQKLHEYVAQYDATIRGTMFRFVQLLFGC
jgi:hypothetical protein